MSDVVCWHVYTVSAVRAYLFISKTTVNEAIRFVIDVYLGHTVRSLCFVAERSSIIDHRHGVIKCQNQFWPITSIPVWICISDDQCNSS